MDAAGLQSVIADPRLRTNIFVLGAIAQNQNATSGVLHQIAASQNQALHQPMRSVLGDPSRPRSLERRSSWTQGPFGSRPTADSTSSQRRGTLTLEAVMSGGAGLPEGNGGSPASTTADCRRSCTVHATLAGLGVTILVAGCAPFPAPSVGEVSPAGIRDTFELHPGLRVVAIGPGIWVHTSSRRYSNGRIIPSNGLIIATRDGPVLIDTAWDDEQTSQVLAWIERQFGRPVRKALVTHAHDDRMGGMGALRRAGVRAAALTLTSERAATFGWQVPDTIPALAIKAYRFAPGVEVYYPGPGHTPDNVVVWVANARLVFGGCLIKDAAAKNLGFTGDADLAGWPQAVERVRAAYPEAIHVVPGHGAPGGTELFGRTVALLSAGKGGS